MKPADFLLERYFARWEFNARWLLSSSDCESVAIAELLDLDPGAREAFLAHRLGYTESAGAPVLREEIAAIYQATPADGVLVHSGAEEAIFNFVNSALEAGDHVIVHEPAYQSLYALAEANGVTVTRWRAREQEGWALDVGELAAAVTPRTRAVILNCPHNPTGYLIDRERFAAVVDLCRRHGLWLFSDEVYRELEHDPALRLPAACDVYEKAVSLGVLSKTYGLPGLRIGWIASRDPALFRRMAAFKDYLTICNAAPSEFLATVALRNRAALAERNLRIVRANLDLADAFFARQAGLFEWRRPTAGPIAFPRINGSAQTFCRRMVEGHGILLLPSTVYEYGDSHIRFGFGRANFPEALAALEEALATRAA